MRRDPALEILDRLWALGSHAIVPNKNNTRQNDADAAAAPLITHTHLRDAGRSTGPFPVAPEVESDESSGARAWTRQTRGAARGAPTLPQQKQPVGRL